MYSLSSHVLIMGHKSLEMILLICQHTFFLLLSLSFLLNHFFPHWDPGFSVMVECLVLLEDIHLYCKWARQQWSPVNVSPHILQPIIIPCVPQHKLLITMFQVPGSIIIIDRQTGMYWMNKFVWGTYCHVHSPLLQTILLFVYILDSHQFYWTSV